MANVVSSQTVLIVDDERMAIRSLQAVLKDSYAAVDGVESSVEALEKLRQSRYDLLFVDLQMPYLDGLSFVEQLRNLEIFTPVILFSGYITPDIMLRAFQFGVIDLVAKPPTLNAIRHTVQDVLRRFSNPDGGGAVSLDEAKRLIHRRKFIEAKVLLENLAEDSQAEDARLLLAMTCEVLGAFDEAEVRYKKALRNVVRELPGGEPEDRAWLAVGGAKSI
jgi:CheY-like chemotaxis protein